MNEGVFGKTGEFLASEKNAKLAGRGQVSTR
jgi:hypothetical protein